MADTPKRPNKPARTDAAKVLQKEIERLQTSAVKDDAFSATQRDGGYWTRRALAAERKAERLEKVIAWIEAEARCIAPRQLQQREVDHGNK